MSVETLGHPADLGEVCAQLQSEAVAMLDQRRRTTTSLVRVTPLEIPAAKRRQYFHGMRIGAWDCHLKLTSLGIALDLTPARGGPVRVVVMAASGVCVRASNVPDPAFIIAKDNHRQLAHLGQDAATVAEIAFQYGLSIGATSANPFFDSPAFDTLAHAVANLRPPLEEVFRRHRTALADWYAKAMAHVQAKQMARHVSAVSPVDSAASGHHTEQIDGVDGTEGAEGAGRKAERVEALVQIYRPVDTGGRRVNIKLPRAAMLGWSQRHGLDFKSNSHLQAALQDAAELVLLEYLALAPGQAKDDGDATSWLGQIVMRAQAETV